MTYEESLEAGVIGKINKSTGFTRRRLESRMCCRCCKTNYRSYESHDELRERQIREYYEAWLRNAEKRNQVLRVEIEEGNQSGTWIRVANIRDIMYTPDGLIIKVS